MIILDKLITVRAENRTPDVVFRQTVIRDREDIRPAPADHQANHVIHEAAKINLGNKIGEKETSEGLVDLVLSLGSYGDGNRNGRMGA